MRSTAHIAFLLLVAVWGSNFLTMKWASDAITPGQIALLRVTCGFVPVLLYALAAGVMSRGHLRYVHHFLVMSVLTTSLHYFAFASGTALLDSGIAGALAGSIPLFTLVTAAAFLRSEAITPGRIAGIVVGFGGVLLIARPWSSGGGLDVVGVGHMLLGSALFGLSFVYAKRFLVGLDLHPAALTAYQLGLGALTLAAVTPLTGITAVAGDSRDLVGVVLGLGLLGTGLAYILYYFVLDRLGAVAASSSTYLPPVIALALGWLVAGEVARPLDGLAILLILAGVFVSAMPSRPRPAVALRSTSCREILQTPSAVRSSPSIAVTRRPSCPPSIPASSGTPTSTVS
jgi:drug/metabolite transporter (DMT)-like permease